MRIRNAIIVALSSDLRLPKTSRTSTVK